jgi:2-(1,2-epoxy-1,2-dihydrophenyl)acetyl-CoA isomerase
MSEFNDIVYELADGIVTIALNRPQTLNALTNQALTELAAALTLAADDPACRVLIFTGRGRGFCAGQDLKEHQVQYGAIDIGEHIARYYNPLALKLYHFPKPTIAMVNGVAAGAGMSLALACDFRIASQAARFSQAFSDLGLVPDSGSSYFLPRLVGVARALEMAMLGDVMDAATALQWGLVHRLVEAEMLEKETMNWARRLAEGPPLALSMIKESIHRGIDHNLSESLEWERGLQSAAARTYDHQEGVHAFLNKRTPEFRGH